MEGVSNGKRGVSHPLPDLDRAIYLKVSVPIDFNAAGTGNIFDRIIVSQGFRGSFDAALLVGAETMLQEI